MNIKMITSESSQRLRSLTSNRISVSDIKSEVLSVKKRLISNISSANISQIHQQQLVNGELIVNGQLAVSGSGLLNGENIATEPFTEALVNDALEGYATEQYVDNLLEDYATQLYVENILEDYATEQFVQESIQDLATENYVDSKWATTLLINSPISNFVSSTTNRDLTSIQLSPGIYFLTGTLNLCARTFNATFQRLVIGFTDTSLTLYHGLGQTGGGIFRSSTYCGTNFVVPSTTSTTPSFMMPISMFYQTNTQKTIYFCAKLEFSGGGSVDVAVSVNYFKY
jgi:hypothetical protein